MSKVEFAGTTSKGKINYLVFNVQNKVVEVPVPKHITDLVEVYLQKFAVPEPKPVERGNDEDSL